MAIKHNWMSYRICRLQGYGVIEAFVAVLAHQVCGTRIFWYPKRQRAGMKKERECPTT